MPHIAVAAASAIAAAAPAGMTAAVGSAATVTAAKVGVMATMKSIAFKALTNIAITAAMSAFQPQVGISGRPVEWTLNVDGPIPFAAGRVGVAGSVIHKETFGPDLMYYGLVSVLSGAGPIDGYESFWADDGRVVFNASGTATTPQWRDEMWLKTTMGHQPDAALVSPALKKGATLPGWSASNKLSGKAAYMLVMGENSKGSAYPTGEVKPIHVLRGLRVWDPRLDSTYPGGSGPCRLHDASTWVYSANPHLWALKWSLGLWEGPTLKGVPAHGSLTDYQVGGIGAKLSGIDVPTLVAAANIADANGWTCAAYPTTDDDKSQVLDSFLQAGGAIYAQRAGKISCIQRAAPRTSIATITVADTAGPIELDTAASRIDRINTIRPKFWSEAHRWQLQALDDVTAAEYRAEDGGTRPRPLDFHYVDQARQCSQLAALQIAHTREGIAGIVPLKPHLQRIKPGDCFAISEPGFVLDGVKCLCLNTDFDSATKIVKVTFVSETDGKYAWALGQNPTPPAPPVLTPVDPSFVSGPLPGDWVVTPRPPAAGGGQLPGFDLGGGVSNDTATAVIVEYGPSASGPWKQAYQGPPTVETIPLDNLQPGETYFIAVQYQRNQNYSDRYIYGPYVAPMSEPSYLQGEPVQDVLDRLTDVQTLSAQNAAAVTDLEAVYGDTVSAAESALAAGNAANLAALKAGEAGGAANASNVSAGIASTKANEAGNSAAAATASQLSANAAKDAAVSAAVALMPDGVRADTLYSGSHSGSPDTRPNLSGVVNGVLTSGVGTNATAFFKAAVPWKAGEIYEVTIEVEGVSGSVAPTASPYAVRLKSNYVTDNSVPPFELYSWVNTPAGQTTRRTLRFGLDVLPSGGSGIKIPVGPDVAFVRFGALINYGSAADRQSRLKFLSIRNITTQLAAANSANASVLAAAQASASAGEAGDWAAASEGSATSAAGSAGQALTHRNAASDARDGAVAASLSAGTSASSAQSAKDGAEADRVLAQGAAATAISQSSNASAAAAAAQISADLAVGVANANPNKLLNSTALAGMDHWVNSSPYGEIISAEAEAMDGARFAHYASSATSEPRYMSDRIPWGDVKTSVSAEVYAHGLTSGAIRFYAAFYNSANTLLDYAVSEHYGNTAGWVPIKNDGFQAPAGTAYVCCFMDTYQAQWSAGGAGFWRKMKIEHSDRASPWNDLQQTAAVAAQLNITAAVAASTADQVGSARFNVTGGAGGDPFDVSLVAGPDGSAASLTATKIRLRNIVDGTAIDALTVQDGRATFGNPITVTKGTRRATLGPGFGVAGNLLLWSGPTSVAFGAETVENGILGISEADGFFGGRTINGPFDSGVGSATVIGLSTAWTAVATVAAKDIGATGSFLFRADWQATLSPKSPPSEAPIYGLNWRVVSTNQSGSDLRVVASGYVVERAGIANVPMGQPYMLIEGHTSLRGSRRLVLQLALAGDDVEGASARNARLRGVYYQT